jgi:hypothetical protein
MHTDMRHVRGHSLDRVPPAQLETQITSGISATGPNRTGIARVHSVNLASYLPRTVNTGVPRLASEFSPKLDFVGRKFEKPIDSRHKLCRHKIYIDFDGHVDIEGVVRVRS